MTLYKQRKNIHCHPAPLFKSFMRAAHCSVIVTDVPGTQVALSKCLLHDCALPFTSRASFVLLSPVQNLLSAEVFHPHLLLPQTTFPCVADNLDDKRTCVSYMRVAVWLTCGTIHTSSEIKILTHGTLCAKYFTDGNLFNFQKVLRRITTIITATSEMEGANQGFGDIERQTQASQLGGVKP